MATIFGKYGEEAAQVAMNDTINFSEKLAPFINPDLLLQKEVFICLNEMKIDSYNCHILHKFLQEYGGHRIQTVQAGGIAQITTIMSETPKPQRYGFLITNAIEEKKQRKRQEE